MTITLFCVRIMAMEQKVVFQTFALSKLYKEFKAVDAVDMTIYEGDIYGFVGENGAGKTTLIRLACGLIHPTSGDYSIFGVSSQQEGIAKARSKTAAIVEAVALCRSLTALDNLKLHANLVGVHKTEEELNQILEDVGLDAKTIVKKKVGNFSLGMRQRLGIALALLSNPKFVILDEPMNGLDPQGFIDVRETILKLNKQGVTFLISSHILSELDKICTRVGFLTHGRLVKEISFDELHQLARKKISLRIKDAEKVSKLLIEHFNLKEVKLDGDFIYIYDTLDVNDLMKFIFSQQLVVGSISSSEETIEDFYQQLIKGGAR